MSIFQKEMVVPESVLITKFLTRSLPISKDRIKQFPRCNSTFPRMNLSEKDSTNCTCDIINRKKAKQTAKFSSAYSFDVEARH